MTRRSACRLGALGLALLLPCCGGGGGGALVVGQLALLVRGPQVAQVTATTVLIAWRSDAPAIGQVDFGTAPTYEGAMTGAAPTTEHVIQLTGLQPDTRYDYRLRLDGAVVSEGHAFTTASADPASPLRFVAIGDNGKGTAAQAVIAEGILAVRPDLLLHTGDVIYEFGLPSELDPAYFEPYAGLIDRVPFYITLGDHEVIPTGGGPLLDAIYMPRNDLNGSERFYSFDRGAVHFVCLDTSVRPTDIQLVWLEDDLAATTATWIVVFTHRPFFSSSVHGSTPAVTEKFGPALERYGVDLVLTGHDHDYERTFPMAAEAVVDAAQEPDYVDPGGPIYIVTGGGGAELYRAGVSYFTAFSAREFHFVQVDVAGRRLDLEAIDWTGAVLDRISITKNP